MYEKRGTEWRNRASTGARTENAFYSVPPPDEERPIFFPAGNTSLIDDLTKVVG